MSTGQIKIGREFFAKVKLDYSNWQWAIVREFLQNCFDAPGCDEVTVTINTAPGGTGTLMVVQNNGAPMDRGTLTNKLLTLGGSGKNFEGENTGGFGVAKSLLYYCHREYTIHTGGLVVRGSGASYTIEEGKQLDGTRSQILLAEPVGSLLEGMVRRFASMAQWKGTLKLNGTVTPCSLHKGARRKDLKWGVVYTNNSFVNLCIVRLNGQPMFTYHCRYKGCVLVELTGKAKDCLTSNRDGLNGRLANELQDLLTSIAIDKRSALKEQRAEYKRYLGAKAKAEAEKPKAGGGLAALVEFDKILKEVGIGTPDGVDIGGGIVDIKTVGGGPAPSAGGIKMVIASTEDAPKHVTLGTEFILKNTSGRNIPKRFIPGDTFANSSKHLVVAWTGVLLKLHQLCNVSGEFSVGFVFDDETIAQHEQGIYGKVYYINPLKTAKAWACRHDLISSAAHEIVHGAYGIKEHDEDYAGKLTEVMAAALKGARDLERLCKRPAGEVVKKGDGGGVVGSVKVELFGHAATGIVRWMGARGWKFGAARMILDELGAVMADATVKTQLYCGLKGTRGAPPVLTAKQVKQLEELYEKYA